MEDRGTVPGEDDEPIGIGWWILGCGWLVIKGAWYALFAFGAGYLAYMGGALVYGIVTETSFTEDWLPALDPIAEIAAVFLAPTVMFWGLLLLAAPFILIWKFFKR